MWPAFAHDVYDRMYVHPLKYYCKRLVLFNTASYNTFRYGRCCKSVHEQVYQRKSGSAYVQSFTVQLVS